MGLLVKLWEFLKRSTSEIWGFIVWLFFGRLTEDKECTPVSYVSDFSPSAYMGRIEKAAVEIMQEAEKKPKYQLVLWAGLDGLRLNDDGTSTWIRREEDKPKAVAPVQSGGFVSEIYCDVFGNVSCETQNRIAQLQNCLTQQTVMQSTLNQLQLQLQNCTKPGSYFLQNCAMQSSVQHPAYTPAYTQYYQPTYYSAVNQCCARQ